MAQQAPANTNTTATAEMRSYNIPVQSLSEALITFGQQSGLQVTTNSGLVEGKLASPVNGSMSAQQALSRLLAGTGLSFQINGGMVSLVPTESTTDITTLPAVRISASSTQESAYGPVEGYVATRSATGTKTDIRLIETPAAIQVIPRKIFEEQMTTSLKDVYENASGVQQAGSTLNAQTEVLPIIRGFQSPTLMRNGLRATYAGAVDLINIERVEVLKGPASILYGALEPGGIVGYVTKRPQAEASHTIKQQVGSYDLYRTSLDSTGALTAAEDVAVQS